MKGSTKAIIGIGAIGAVIGGTYLLTKKASGTPTPSCDVASIQLSATPTTVSPGGTVVFTAVAYDTNGNPVDNASLTLVEVTTNTMSTPATTDTSGTAEFSVTFPTDTEPGNYVFVAEAC